MRVAAPHRPLIVVVREPWMQPRREELPASVRDQVPAHEAGRVWPAGRELLMSVAAYRVWRRFQGDYIARPMARVRWRDGREYWHAVTCGGRLIDGPTEVRAAPERGVVPATPIRAVSPARVQLRGCGGCARRRKARERAHA